MEQLIGIIGHGKLGHVIEERLKEKGYEVTVSDQEQDNEKVAAESRNLMLCVKPFKAAEVAEQIRGKIKATGIISFMAAVPLKKLEQYFGRRIQRAMTNLGMDSISCTNGNAEIVELCRNLTRGKLVEAVGDEKIDLFTTAIGCLPGVAAWFYGNHQEQAEKWLKEWSRFMREKTDIDAELFAKIIEDTKRKGDYEATVKRVATPGGITEAIIKELEEDMNAGMEEILLAATKRTEEMAEKA